MMDSIEGVLQQQGYLVLSTVGKSMWPLIREGRDSVKLEAIYRKIVKNDVVLYRSKSGMMILHRVTAIRGKTYTCCGDSQWVGEKDISESDLIAVLTGIYRENHFYSVDSCIYRIYCKVWCSNYWLRKVGRFVDSCIWKIRHLLIK